jgi:hypothetical protein
VAPGHPAVVQLTGREREARELALRACREQGCTCEVEFIVEGVDGLDAPAVAVVHEDWCPLLRTMQERPPGRARWQAVLRPPS